MEGPEPVALAWVVILGFVRLSTHPRLAARPRAVSEACPCVGAWLAQPQVSTLASAPARRRRGFACLQAPASLANLTTNAHLAALAIEHQALLHSTDADFARFPGLRWRNPLPR